MRSAIVYHKQLGDTLLLQPVIEKLAGTGPPVDLFTLPGHKPLVQLMPGAAWGTPAQIAETTYQRVIAFDPSTKSLMRCLRLHARERYLVSRADLYVRWHHQLLFDACLCEGLCTRYVARYYQEMLFGSAAAGEFSPPRLHQPPNEWRQGQPPSSRIVINPVSGWERKCWTVDGWRQVIQTILDRGLGPIDVTGGNLEWHQSICREICDGFPDHTVRNMAGKTSMKEFLIMLADAPLVLTVDGAASHIAQAFGRPTVVLFGPSKPQMWHYETDHNRSLHSVEFSGETFESVAHTPTEFLPPTSLIPPDRVIEETLRIVSLSK